jgi:hypothetical protein
MSSKQKVVLALAVVLLTFSELFPPWQYEDEGTSGVRPARYHYFYSPPKVKSPSEMQAIFSYPNQEAPCCVWAHKDRERLNAHRLTLIFLLAGLFLSLSNSSAPVYGLLGGIAIFFGSLFLAISIWLGFQSH